MALRISIVVLLGLLIAGSQRYAQSRLEAFEQFPKVQVIDVYAELFDMRPITVMATFGPYRAPWRTTVHDVVSEPTLWRRMHLADWNDVPSELRRRGLDAMLVRYRHTLMRPDVWNRMSPEDWDEVPQPVRTVAFRRMAALWSGYYGIGARYRLNAQLVADTLAAIVMSESWFDHRGRHVNPDGTADIGLGGASAFARGRLRTLFRCGEVDVDLREGDYENPFMATRFVALWFDRMLEEAGGDLNVAIRAYNRGIQHANDDAGAAYFDVVLQRRTRFIRNQDAPPAWNYVWERTRHIELDWP